MRQKMAQSGLTAPTFASNRESDEFEATFLLHHFMTENDWTWLASFKEDDLTEDQTRALIFVREVGAIDNSTYRSLTQTDTLTASRNLRHLRSIDLLADRGSGARTHYVAGPRFPHDSMDVNATKIDDNMDANADGAARPRYSRGGTRMASVSDLPPGLRLRLQALGRRLEPEHARELIGSLCEWRALTAEEIANLMGKTTAYVSQKYLYRMVRDGELNYLYPEMVKHPGQRYTKQSKRRER